MRRNAPTTYALELFTKMNIHTSATIVKRTAPPKATPENIRVLRVSFTSLYLNDGMLR